MIMIIIVIIVTQVFYSKLKTLLFHKSYPCSSSSPAFLTVSMLNTIHHSPPTVYLPASLDLDPLPIDFVLVKRLWISWFPRLHFCGCCRSLEFPITVTIDQRSFESHVALIKKTVVRIKKLGKILEDTKSHGIHGFATSLISTYPNNNVEEHAFDFWIGTIWMILILFIF